MADKPPLFSILAQHPRSLRSPAQHEEHARKQLIEAARHDAKQRHGIDIDAAQAERIAQSFAFLTGRSDVHPDELVGPEISAEARAIIAAGRRRRGEAGNFSKADDVPRGQEGRPLPVDSEAFKIVMSGRKRRSEIP
jgi:hypothetical protein